MPWNLNIKRLIAVGLVFSFLASSLQPSYAQTSFSLPQPGQMLSLSKSYKPVVMRGIKIDPANPFRFNFLVDEGDTRLNDQDFKDEAQKVIKYFLTSLTIPDDDLWVNLSPYEKDRTIPQEFGQTEMGLDLLAQDYILKQITASLIYPENEIGKKFWEKVYKLAQEKYGLTNIPINTFNKVWIVPDHATVYQHQGTAFVLNYHLKVMLEQDYLALDKNKIDQSDKKEISSLSSQVVRSIVLPELEKEVNSGKNFASLRQVFYSLILATWYKTKVKQAILNRVYADKEKVAGILVDDPQAKAKIYRQYLQAFKKGVFNYIKDDLNRVTNETIPRKYFSGGVLGHIDPAIIAYAPQVQSGALYGMRLRNVSGEVVLINGKKVMPDQAMNNRLEKPSVAQLRNNQELFDAWSEGPKAINDLVFQARKLGFEGGILKLTGESYRLKPFQGSLEHMEWGPPLFKKYVHPILISTGWWHPDMPGEIWRNVMHHANSDAVFMWRESEQGYEGIMFDYGPGIVDRQGKPVENIKGVLEYRRSYGNSKGDGVGAWLYGKYSYLTRLISVNGGYIRVVDKKPGYFTEESNTRDVGKMLTQTDVKYTGNFHGVIVHVFVPFNKDEYKGSLSAVTEQDVLGIVNTEQASTLERDQIWRQNPSNEVLNLSGNDVGRPVEITVHVSSRKNTEVKIVGKLKGYSDNPKGYYSSSGEPFRAHFEIQTMEDTAGVMAGNRNEIFYSQVRKLKFANYEVEVHSENDVKLFMKHYRDTNYRWDIPIEVTYETQYDAGELKRLKGTIQELPSPENQGSLKIKSKSKKLVIGINRIKEFKFIDEAMVGQKITFSGNVHGTIPDEQRVSNTGGIDFTSKRYKIMVTGDGQEIQMNLNSIGIRDLKFDGVKFHIDKVLPVNDPQNYLLSSSVN